MPRLPRKLSPTGYYHITNRGAAKTLFLTDKDRSYFIDCIARAQEVCDFSVLAYCIMSTHYHIVIKCEGAVPPQLFQSIGARFAHYFHRERHCEGAVFRGRFYSEPIHTEAHLLSAIRYVWRNPVKARMCPSVDAYKWSSYSLMGKGKSLIDERELYALMSEGEWRDFADQEEPERYVEPFSHSLTGDAAASIMRRIARSLNLALDSCPKSPSLPYFVERCLREGVKVSQISREIGMSGSELYAIKRRLPAFPAPVCTGVAMASP